MKTSKALFCFFMLLTLVCCSESGGGGRSSTETTPVVTTQGVTLSSIAITSTFNSVPAGQTIQLTATGNYSDNSSANLTGDVTWTVSKTDYATISTAGLVSGIFKGSVEISATYNGISGTLLMAVYDLSDLSDLIISSRSTSIPVDQQMQVDVSGIFSDGSIQNVVDYVTFSITSGNASITDTGLLTGTAIGNVIVKVCLNGICNDFEITINPQSLTQIVVSAENTEVPNGLNIQLTATGTYSDGSTIDISDIATWVSSNNAIAEPNVETPSQFMTKQAGIATATATYGDKSANIVITILETAIESIIITRESGEYPRKYFTFLEATGIFTDGSTINLTNDASWRVDDISIARVFNGEGYTGFFVTIAEGSVEVTATYNSVEKSEIINISSETLSGFDIKPDSAASYLPLVLESDNSISLEISGIYSDGTVKDFSRICNWYSLTNDILSINNSDPEKGNVSPITEGDGAVVAIIGKSGILQPVTVIKPVASYTISTTYSIIPTHTDIIFTAEVEFEDGSVGDNDITNLVSWNSYTTDVIRFYDDIKYYAHALSPGSPTISASLQLNGNTDFPPDADISLTVEPLNSITLVPYNINNEIPPEPIDIEDIVRFMAYGQSVGSPAGIGFNITNYVEWASSNENFIPVNNNPGSKGEITVNLSEADSVTISAEADDGTGTNPITGSLVLVP